VKFVRKAAKFLVLFTCTAGASAGVVVAWSAYTSEPSEAAIESDVLQQSNHTAKADRLPVVQTSAQAAPSFQLASVNSGHVPAQLPPGFRMAPAEQLAPMSPAPMALAPTTPDVAWAPVHAPAAAAPEKPKRAAAPLPPPPPEHKNAILDESQISSIKTRLRLTESQIEYWPAVEAALLDVVRKHARSVRNRSAYSGAPKIDVNSPEVQSLVWAAMPLLMRLREDQKKEVRQLARVLGLESVASQI
jgi:hypothetical protein